MRLNKKTKWLTEKTIRRHALKSDRAALLISIRHWKQILNAPVSDLRNAFDECKVRSTDEYCGLCRRFCFGVTPCTGCPLFETAEYCGNTGSPWGLADTCFFELLNGETRCRKPIKNLVKLLESLKDTVKKAEG